MDPTRKTRSDCRLSQLTPEQQDEVIAHCESVKIADGVSWLKSEFNVTIGDDGLGRWLKKQRVHSSASVRLDQIREARDHAMLIGKVVGSATEITEANIALIAQAVFDELVKPAEERDEEKLAQYMALAIKVNDQNIKTRAGNLAFERFHFDAAKKALAFTTQLGRINEGAGDDRAKIEEAMVLLFGKPVTVEH